ncbi:methylated-DNA--[protein]-cysteine S-methyltransferase [Apibacter muscae]|uniref:methylated-DNA--[protein]-cysteine S-methyltransferase n=1 Tax=Apibacter muscae TaxID=2509004 RepID=UPI0011ADC668|nr:methylated-DNA--[protein]-cysteine S-methyltransferase [Apibacter muscae]TWP27593.1 methylated-DNA--[protein]-cysteine S-methyltransferase [Apibacter muscae]
MHLKLNLKHLVSNIKIQYYKSPVGKLVIGAYKEKICLCDWLYRKKREVIDSRIKGYLEADYIFSKSEVIDQTIIQLKEYFNKERKTFNIPILLCGSEFQKLVWTELMNVPYGRTTSYLELSKNIKNINAIRAVANANGANGISIIIPCHRIIGVNGGLTGYSGGLKAKKKLLELEAPFIQTTLF